MTLRWATSRWEKVFLISIIAISIVGSIVYTLYAFLSSSEISLPLFEHMRPEWEFTIAATVEVDWSDWPDFRVLYSGDRLEYEESIELWVVIDSFHVQRGYAVGRTLYRNEDKIRVVYMLRTETQLSLMRRRFGPTRLTQVRYSRTGALQDMGYGQQTVEIYYLQSLRHHLGTIEELSDEDFDALREEASFVWRGIFDIPIPENMLRREHGLDRGVSWEGRYR